MSPSTDIAPAELAFVCCIEGTAIESQALLLCESIRRYAGPYANAPIVAVTARPDHPIAARSERRLAELAVRYVCEPLNLTRSPYLTINRIVAGAWAEQHLDARYVVMLDSDMLFVRAPSFVRADVGVRPVDTKGSASSGPGDALDAYWHSICALAGISVDALPWLTASIEGTRIRASYNGGFCIARRELGVLQKTHRVFEASRVQDLRPRRGVQESVFASTGSVGLAASEWWGSSQAALSAAIHASTTDVAIYDPRYNVPLHLIATEPGAQSGWAADELILLHYHSLLGDDYRAEFLRRLTVLGIDGHVIAWLQSTLANAS